VVEGTRKEPEVFHKSLMKKFKNGSQNISQSFSKCSEKPLKNSTKTGKVRFPYEFQKITHHSIPGKNLAIFILNMLKAKESLGEKESFLYEICGNLIFSSDPPPIELFEEYFEFGERHEDLRGIRNRTCQW